MRASNEALFNELDPEERLRLTAALHLNRPDGHSHLDRPLVVEGNNGGGNGVGGGGGGGGGPSEG